MAGTSALIASFVVRLIKDGEGAPLRVTVRHVQTGRELRFLRLADALEYMDTYSREPMIESQTEE